eukprot:6413942-Amphidinium_carterae.1
MLNFCKRNLEDGCAWELSHPAISCTDMHRLCRAFSRVPWTLTCRQIGQARTTHVMDLCLVNGNHSASQDSKTK